MDKLEMPAQRRLRQLGASAKNFPSHLSGTKSAMSFLAPTPFLTTALSCLSLVGFSCTPTTQSRSDSSSTSLPPVLTDGESNETDAGGDAETSGSDSKSSQGSNGGEDSNGSKSESPDEDTDAGESGDGEANEDENSGDSAPRFDIPEAEHESGTGGLPSEPEILDCENVAEKKGAIGCEYYIPTPPFYSMGSGSQAGPCHAVLIANSSEKHINLTVSRDGIDYDYLPYTKLVETIGENPTFSDLPDEGIPPQDVAVLFLSHKPGSANSTSLECPVAPILTEDLAAPNSDNAIAFYLESDEPITLYDVLPFGGASSYLPSASLLFPHTAWADNYIGIVPHDANAGSARWILAVAKEDDTTLEVLTSATSIASGSFVVPAPDVASSYTLQAGEVFQLASTASSYSGTTIQSDKPVGFYSGHSYLGVTTATSSQAGGYDSSHQQIPGVQNLGSEYLAPHVPTRLADASPESVLYRLTGVVDGTELSYEPAAPAGAPATLDQGESVEFQATETFTIRSQDDDHPFSLSQYMGNTIQSGAAGGCFQDPNCTQLGDTDWIVILPPAQFIRTYSFLVDPTYGYTHAVFMREKEEGEWVDVELDCYGTVDGWQDVGAEDKYQVATVELFKAGLNDAHPECQTSRHFASSEANFGLIVWGYDYFASYGYPAGGGAQAINNVVIPVE